MLQNKVKLKAGDYLYLLSSRNYPYLWVGWKPQVMSKITLDYTNNISQSPFEHSKSLKNKLEGV